VSTCRAPLRISRLTSRPRTPSILFFLPSSAQMSTLGNGWVTATDPGSGRTYYYNQLTQTTSWEYPADL
jgi:hypothetical protein